MAATAEPDYAAIRQGLLAVERTIDRQEFFSGVEPGATELVLNDPYAFCLAICLDRGMDSRIVWTIPYWIKESLGHLDPLRIAEMPDHALVQLVNALPRRPRFANASPRTIREMTRIVVEECGGHAERIWEGRAAADVKATFRRVYGVGQGLANMAVLLIERAYAVRFPDLDRRSMDIKPDVHTRRVLYRLGIIPEQTEAAALRGARALSPEYPGEIDAALWYVGRQWCTARVARCAQCPLAAACAGRGIGHGQGPPEEPLKPVAAGDESRSPRLAGNAEKGQAGNMTETRSKYRGTTAYFRVYAELINAARYRGLTTYQAIAQIMGLPLSGNYMGAEVGRVLGEITADEVAAGRPMLSALVVGVSGLPGPGFAPYARQLGRFQGTSREEELAFWEAECKAVYEAWQPIYR